MIQLRAAFLAFGLATFVRGQQNVGTDGITTVATATCTTTGTQTYAFADAANSIYQYMCGGGSGGSTLTVIPSASVTAWQACFNFCDNNTACSGFTFVSQKLMDLPWHRTGFVSLVAAGASNFADSSILPEPRRGLWQWTRPMYSEVWLSWICRHNGTPLNSYRRIEHTLYRQYVLESQDYWQSINHEQNLVQPSHAHSKICKQ